MPKQDLVFSDLDLSSAPRVVTRNLCWRKCINLALRSRSEDQRYGSLVILKGKIIGEGWNRLLGRDEPFPFRTSFFLHAEKAAIGDAIIKVGKSEIVGARVYVAGFFVDERKPLILSTITNTCVVCTKWYPEFGLNAAFISYRGWVRYSGELAYQNALQGQKIRKERNLTTRQLREEISL